MITYPAFDARSRFEPFRRMLEFNVGVMVWPNHSINITRYRDEKATIRKTLNGPLDDFTNVNISDLKIILVKNRLSEG